jgi:NADPH:quinone reductase-like Zn-dependent oxidoreductase
MRAVEYTERGAAAQVLRQVDLPQPEPGAGEVRVQIMV